MTKNAASETWLLANEFAQVRLSIDRSGNGPRLKIEDLPTGRSISLDALVLSGLVWATDDALAVHVDPDAPHAYLARLAGKRRSE